MLTYVAPERLDELWPWIDATIERLRAKVQEAGDSRAVYDDIAAKDAGLYLVGDDGFQVVQLLTEASRRVLFVWMLYSPSLRGEAWDRYAAEMERMAVAMRCSVIRFTSKRRGWKRNRWMMEVAAGIYERRIAQR